MSKGKIKILSFILAVFTICSSYLVGCSSNKPINNKSESEIVSNVDSSTTVNNDKTSNNEKKTEVSKDSKGGVVAHIQSFEDKSWTEKYLVEEGKGKLSTSSKHYKLGKESLEWTWENGGALTVNDAENMMGSGAQERGGVIVWLYNEKPLTDGKLTFTLKDRDKPNETVPYTWDFKLDFKGWRAMWIDFKYDAVNPKWGTKDKALAESPKFNQMEIVPSTDSGTIYIDVVEFVNNLHWCRSRDYQFPYQRTDKDFGRGGTWERAYEYIKRVPSDAYNTYPEITEYTPEQAAAFETIEKRLEQWIYPDDIKNYLNQEPMKIREASLQEYIKEGKQDFLDLNIDPETLTGVPLFASRSPYITEKSFVKAAQKDKNLTAKQFGSDVATEIFLPLYFDYKLNEGGDKNCESYKNLITLFKYYHDQGWAEGSGLGTPDHETNRSSGYFVTVYLLREELKKEKPVDDRYTSLYDEAIHAMEWYTDFGKVFGVYGDLEKGYKETTSDELRTHFLYRLLYVLSMENSPEKVKAMTGYLEWIKNALAINPNFAGTIKPDYTGFHHRGIYANAYSPNGYHMAALINYILHGTEFAMDTQSQINLKGALTTSFLIADKYDLPQSLTGRMPHSTRINSTISPAFAYMALSGNPVTNEKIDKDMAGIFMQLWNPEHRYFKENLFPACRAGISYFDTLGGMKIMLDFANQGYPKTDIMEGFWTKPYGGLTIHRRDDWVVANKGWSQYVFDFESGGKKNENVYGRYMSYGAQQIMTHHNPVADGYDIYSGWDWNRIPGTTTIHLGFDDLSSANGSLREGTKMTKYAHRNFSKETFLGGVSSEGNNGMFSMKLRDDVYHNPDFTANKTSFFFDDEIICLGSNITNSDNRGNTETTLFQFASSLDNKAPNMSLNGTEISENIDKAFGKDGKNVWLLDPAGNGYYIPDAENVHIFRGEQSSRKATWSGDDELETKGYSSTAWIDHGKEPKDSSYEYVIKVKTTSENMKKYVDSPKTYNILQQDSTAHILKHNIHNTTAYAIFDTAKFNEGKNEKLKDEILVNTDTPIMVMVKNQNNNEVVFSLCDPDLNIPVKKQDQGMTEEEATTNSEMKTTKVVLKGKWKIKEGFADNSIRIIENESIDNKTVLEFDCINAETKEIVLQQI